MREKQKHSKSKSKIQRKKKDHGGDMNQMLSTAYSATASAGKALSWINLAIGIIIGIVVIIIGVFVMRINHNYNTKTVALIKSATCSGSGKNTSCTLSLSYTVNGKSLTSNTTASGIYNVNQSIPIKYDSTNPQDITTTTISHFWIGFGLIILGLIIIIASCVWCYVVQTNDTIAAASGTAGVIGIVDSGFNNGESGFNQGESGFDQGTSGFDQVT